MERVAAKPKLLEGPNGEYKQPGDYTERITPIEDFFVISHMANADVDPASWRLDIAGMVGGKAALTLDDLRRYPKKTMECVHKCAGSPRDPWTPTRQVANVRWGGVDLRDVLEDLRVADEATHLWAYGLEYGAFFGVEQAHYLKDIPRSRIDEGDVLIAYEVNGAPLTARHGAPARLLVPGYYGANSVKWVCRLELQDRRAESLFTRVFYNDRDYDLDPTGQTMRPVWALDPESIIVAPITGDRFPGGDIEIWGWAWSNCAVTSVDVSFDGGATWRQAALEPRTEYAWQKFQIVWRPERSGEFDIRCRATDEAGRAQPMARARNAVHSISVSVAEG